MTGQGGARTCPNTRGRIGSLKKAALKLSDPGLEVLKQEARARNLPPG